ncbi:MAG: glutathione S-transferase family protein [Caulobacterales bacterium]|nr:glutathione S-transferase family protein [Caulobacterales bacterium]
MTITHLKLFHGPATRSARVKWLLHALFGDGFETARVDLYDGEQYAPAYMEMNPHHAVPVLEVAFAGGETRALIESGAMIAWLADLHPDAGLAPPPGPTPERADYLQMLHFGVGSMDVIQYQIRIHEHLLPPGERDPRLAARYRAKFAAEVEPQLAARLQRHAFICGEAFTAADCVIGHNVVWARGYGQCQDDVFRAYLSRVSKRPAFVAAFADAREFTPEVPAGKAILEKFTG